MGDMDNWADLERRDILMADAVLCYSRAEEIAEISGSSSSWELSGSNGEGEVWNLEKIQDKKREAEEWIQRSRNNCLRTKMRENPSSFRQDIEGLKKKFIDAK